MVYLIQNRSDLEQQIQQAGEKLVVIDFFAKWCGPCKLVTPTLEALEAKYAEQAVMLKVDVDICDDIAMAYDISGMPTFVFIKNNHVIDIFIGGNPEKLTMTVDKLVSPEAEPEKVEEKQVGDHNKMEDAEPQAQPLVGATQEVTQEIAQDITQENTNEITCEITNEINNEITQ